MVGVSFRDRSGGEVEEEEGKGRSTVGAPSTRYVGNTLKTGPIAGLLVPTWVR